MPSIAQIPNVPLLMRVAHYDTVLISQPISILSVVRSDPKIVNYENCYKNKNLRAALIMSGDLAFGNGGTLANSIVFNDSAVKPYTGACFMLGINNFGYFVGWNHPHYEYDPGDLKAPIWIKTSGYSIEIAVRDNIKVTKADAGTGSEEDVVFIFPVYGLQLVNDQTAYNQDGTLRRWVFYGVANGIKGWYNRVEIGQGNLGAHALLGPRHSDTVPSGPVKGGLIVGTGSSKWKVLPPMETSGTFVLQSNPNDNEYKLSWNEVPAGQSVAIDAPTLKLKLVNDMASPGKNMYYGCDPNKGKGWYRIA